MNPSHEGSIDSSTFEAIAAVMIAERAARDQAQWDRMQAQYHSKGKVRLSWFSGSASDFVARSRETFEQGARSLHILSAPEVFRNEGRALATANAHISILDKVGEVPAVLSCFCRIHERLVLVGRMWRIVDMQVVYLWDALQPRNPAERVVIDGKGIAGTRSSYAFQAYLRQLTGAPIPDDLLGQDRPADVARMTSENESWLADGQG